MKIILTTAALAALALTSANLRNVEPNLANKIDKATTVIGHGKAVLFDADKIGHDDLAKIADALESGPASDSTNFAERMAANEMVMALRELPIDDCEYIVMAA